MQLLKLPPLVQREITFNLSLHELFILSLCSISTSRMITWVLSRKLQAFFMKINGRGNECCIYLEDSVNNTRDIPEKIVCNWTYQAEKLDSQTTSMMLDNTVLAYRTMFNPVTNFHTLILNDDTEKSAPMQLFNHVCKLFRAVSDVNLLLTDLENSQHIPFAKTFAKVYIMKNVVRTETIKTFFDNFKVREALIYAKIFRQISEKSKILEVERLQIFGIHHLSLSNLLQFQGEHAVFTCTNLKTNDIVSFLNNWKFGLQRKLKYLMISTDPACPFNREEILRSVKRPDRKRRPSRFVHRYPHMDADGLPIKHNNLDDGVDIEGFNRKIATIQLQNFIFNFYVWN